MRCELDGGSTKTKVFNEEICWPDKIKIYAFACVLWVVGEMWNFWCDSKTVVHQICKWIHLVLSNILFIENGTGFFQCQKPKIYSFSQSYHPLYGICWRIFLYCTHQWLLNVPQTWANQNYFSPKRKGGRSHHLVERLRLRFGMLR